MPPHPSLPPRPSGRADGAYAEHTAAIVRAEAGVFGELPDFDHDLATVLEGREPGDRVELVYRSRGETRRATVALAADPTLEALPMAEAGLRSGADVLRFRTAWIGDGEGR